MSLRDRLLTRPATRARTLAAWAVLALLLVAATGPARADDPPVPAANAPVPPGAATGGAVATDADSAGRVAPTETPATADDATPSAPAPAPAPAAEAPKPGVERLPLQPPVAVTAPATLNDINAWLEYKTRGHLLALPTEARLFYRRGLLLHASGGGARAERLVRGAARLDPGFIAPRLTLATWVAFRDPGEVLDLLDQVWD